MFLSNYLVRLSGYFVNFLKTFQFSPKNLRNSEKISSKSIKAQEQAAQVRGSLQFADVLVVGVVRLRDPHLSPGLAGFQEAEMNVESSCNSEP